MDWRCRRRKLFAAAVVFAAILPIASGRDGRAQLLPFQRPKVEDFDPHQAFVDGYNDWKRQDWPAAIERMQLAAARVPELADYALFYLGSAQRNNRDPEAAAATFRQLVTNYPQSVLLNQAQLDYAQLELTQGHPELALAAATTVADRTKDGNQEQGARLVMARALMALRDFHGAYVQAETIRASYPAGFADTEARAIAYAILAAHPSVADTESVAYRFNEAALLLHEGQPGMAKGQIAAALALELPLAVRAELIWLEVEAVRANPQAQRDALNRYLMLAPSGSHAAAAVNALAHSWWHAADTALARQYFNRVVREFPGSALAPEAMFEIGRTYEDDGDRAAARAQYQRVMAHYPKSEAAAEGRFRAAFMLYLGKNYATAAAEFAAAETAANSAPQRDMFEYWQARALEQNGDETQARPIMYRLAVSIDSNYYPALAAMKVNKSPVFFPPASVSEPIAAGVPAVAAPAQFHLTRAIALRDAGLRELEASELHALEEPASGNAGLRDFVLAGYQEADAWYDRLVAAAKFAARGELSAPVAERIRYPRGYWPQVSQLASANRLDPYLVLALIHQESLFNPDARSVSDARGLMQLLPMTAEKWAPDAGVMRLPIDLYDPAMSLRIGTTYLRNLFGMFDGDLFKAVAAYNGGEHAVAGWAEKFPGDDDQWVENIEFRETRDYVKKVIGGLREYRLIYQPALAATQTAYPARAQLPPAP